MSDSMTPDHATAALFGRDPTTGIVAVEFTGAAMRLYRRRRDDRVDSSEAAFTPWLVATDESLAVARRFGEPERLSGELPLRWRLHFRDWATFRRAAGALADDRLPSLTLGNPVDQYLIASGQTLFRSMSLDDPVRLQLDIETASLDPNQPDAEILAVALTTNRGDQHVLHRRELSEAGILSGLTELIRRIDPDVIEGHNLFNFDLPFIMARGRRLGVRLAWGRDGSELREAGPRRLRVVARSIPFRAARVHGRHIIDTYQQIQRYDVAGALESYGLKEAIETLGLGRQGRTFVEGAAILATWRRDPERLLSYALDDVADVAQLASLTTPTEFYQTQILPRSYQNVAVGGPGEKINLLLIRAYLAESHSLPLPREPRPYPGGFSEVRRVGVFRPVVKCDVESLYPSIMLHDRIAPASDHLGVYLPLLSTLTQRRLEAKRRAARTSGLEQARWLGLQSSFKVLINSFYGNLGYSRALFNDFDAAERVTLRGQSLIREVVRYLEESGAEPIEIDTDGVYFRPPDDVARAEAGEAYVARISERLPAGINLGYDGTFAGMVSLRMKNYALLTAEGRLILKGSSLRSRRDERVFRRFIEAAARGAIEDSLASLRDIYLDLAAAISAGQLDVQDFARWETISDRTFNSLTNQKLARLAERERARAGERLAVYVRTSGEVARVDDYRGDEDRAYLLRRLRDMARRFRPLFPDDGSFDYTFPELSPGFDLAAVRSAPRMEQQRMFE